MSRLKLEVGKSYRRRDGEIEDIDEYEEGLRYPFISCSGKSFTEFGKYLGEESLQDLIEEVVDEPAVPGKTAQQLTDELRRHPGQEEADEVSEDAPSNEPAACQPKTEKVSPGIDQIPFEGIEAIGQQFAEGESKYGRDNWKRDIGNIAYDRERCRHAMRHLWLWANGDRSENHLAKVAWYCVIQIWRERQR